MPDDFKKKQPNQNERVMYEMMMQMQDMDNRLWSISSHVLAIGILMDTDPKKLAEILTGDETKIKEYAKKVNDEIEKIQAAKKAASPAEESTGQEGHDHSDPNHTH